MILPTAFAFLLFYSVAESRKVRSHLSDTLRLKCDALPYRTAYLEYRCYFAVLKEIDYADASEECSSIFSGATIATKVPADIFKTMMVEKTKFHSGKGTFGTKHLICTFGSEYKCEADHIMLEEGRCLVRASKKMTFADAENHCSELDMELPAPANDLDNRIVRGALVKDPAWVQKSFVRQNGLKWNQGRNYSRWTTCATSGQDPPLYAGNQNALWSCNKDTASVIDNTGYWSNGGTQSVMDVICIKNAANDFTKGADPCVSYHEMTGLEQLPLASHGASLTCYVATRTATRYEVIGKATVETQRGCEVLCDSKPTCAAFSFKDSGLSSSCILLSSKSTNQICSGQTTIYQKKKSGCPERTNITAEFGDDPCIESRVDSAFRGLNVKPVCDNDKSKLYVVRAIDVHGKRITLDNERHNFIRKAGNGFFEWIYDEVGSAGGYAAVSNIVAATCVIAEGDKCPCAPLKYLSISKPNHYAAVTERVQPCNSSNDNIWWDEAKSPAYGTSLLSLADTAASFITCKAGMWILWKQSVYSSWGITTAVCQ